MRKSKGFNDYKIDGEYTIIYLRGKHSKLHPTTIIDTKNLEKLIKLNISWNVHLEVNKKFYYVLGTQYLGMDKNGKSINKSHCSHRFISGETDSKIKIDHIDNNTFNNTEKNFRKTTQKLNLTNRRSKNSNNKSGHRNVSFILGFYRVQLQINEKNKLFPEKFTDVNEAGKFAEAMRIKYYGEYAGLS